MSKVVSGVGDAIGGVLKGAVSVVKSIGEGVGKVVKSIASSNIGKAILIAGAIYFGGAALAGGYGSAAGGGSFFTGMGAGVSSAASSLSSAWTSAMAGNFAEAGSTIGGSWTSAAQSGAMTSPEYAAYLNQPTVSLAESPSLTEVAPKAPPTYDEQLKFLDEIGATPGEVANVSAEQAEQIRNATGYNPDLPANAQQHLLNSPADQIARAPNNSQFLSDLTPNTQLDYSMNPTSGANTGIRFGNAADSWYRPGTGAGTSVWDKVISSPYTAPALISGGMQVGGAIIQGKAQEEALKEQREYEARMAAEARARYNTNVGAQLWDPTQQAAIYQNQGPAWDPYAEARARAAQYAPAPTGLAAKYMNA